MFEKITKKLPSISPIWVAPILALIVAGGLIWQNTINKGPLITIVMESADGIVADKTEVKYRSVNIGIVKQVRLSDDLKQIYAQVQMKPGTDELLKQDSIFWLVSPKISAGRVTGLDTLISGSYINVRRGKSEEPCDTFRLALLEPRGESTGKSFMLIGRGIKNRIQEGDSVLFHGVEIGQVQQKRHELARNLTYYEVYIYGPFVPMIDSRSYFYTYGGIEFSAGPGGIELSVDSFEQILRGGVCMGKFNTSEINPVLDEHIFRVFDNKTQAEFDYSLSMPSYVFFLPAPLKGISPRSKVYLNGIEIGNVTHAAWFEEQNDIYREDLIPVRFYVKKGDPTFVRELFDQKLRNGMLCARVGAAGALAITDKVDLTLLNTEACSHVPQTTYRDLPVVPVVRDADMISSFEAILQKFKEFDTVKLNQELMRLLKNSGDLCNELKIANNDFNRLKILERLVDSLNKIDEATVAVKKTANDYQDGTELYRSLSLAIDDLHHSINALKPTMREVGQKPNALIFGGAKTDPIPGANR